MQRPAYLQREMVVSILQQLGYLTMTFDTAEQNLFSEAWDILAHNSNYTTLQNLTNLLVAIEKIFVPEKLPEISEKLRFGGITHDGVYLLSDENEVNKVYSHFALFNKNKQLLNE